MRPTHGRIDKHAERRRDGGIAVEPDGSTCAKGPEGNERVEKSTPDHSLVAAREPHVAVKHEDLQRLHAQRRQRQIAHEAVDAHLRALQRHQSAKLIAGVQPQHATRAGSSAHHPGGAAHHHRTDLEDIAGSLDVQRRASSCANCPERERPETVKEHASSRRGNVAYHHAGRACGKLNAVRAGADWSGGVERHGSGAGNLRGRVGRVRGDAAGPGRKADVPCSRRERHHGVGRVIEDDRAGTACQLGGSDVAPDHRCRTLEGDVANLRSAIADRQRLGGDLSQLRIAQRQRAGRRADADACARRLRCEHAYLAQGRAGIDRRRRLRRVDDEVRPFERNRLVRGHQAANRRRAADVDAACTVGAAGGAAVVGAQGQGSGPAGSNGCNGRRADIDVVAGLQDQADVGIASRGREV